MSTKTISITEDVYNMLVLEKEENESFSDVVSRLVKRRSKLSDSFGKWEMTDEQVQKFKSDERFLLLQVLHCLVWGLGSDLYSQETRPAVLL
jgi:predicted CopG family antitoxin